MSVSWEADYQRDLAAQKSSGTIVFNEEQRRKNLQLMSSVRDLLPVDDDQKVTDCDLLYRFLIGKHWEVKAAEHFFRQYVKVRAEQKLNGILAEEVAEELRVLLSPVYGVDKDGQPNLWMTPDPSKLLPLLKSHPQEALLRAQMRVMEEARFTSHICGVDRCTYVLDMGKISMSSVNTLTLGFLRELIKILQDYYPECMRRLLIFNTGWAITGAWKVLKPFVDARVVDKIRFFNGPPNVKTLSEFMTTENIMPEYGGTGTVSVLDEPIRKEVERLRARQATPQPPSTPTATPLPASPLPTVVPSVPPPLPPSSLPGPLPTAANATNAGGTTTTTGRESPRSLLLPEELPLDELPAEDNSGQLFSLYTSFTTVQAPLPSQPPEHGQPQHLPRSGSTGGDGSVDNLAHTPLSFRSARSLEALTAADAGAARTGPVPRPAGEGEGGLLMGAWAVFPRLWGTYGVGNNYLGEDRGLGSSGARQASELSEDGDYPQAPSLLASDEDKDDDADEAESAGLAPPTATAPATAAPLSMAPSTFPVRPVKGPHGPAAAAHADPLASSPSLPSLPSYGSAVFACVELGLVQSADGRVLGYRGRQRIGECHRGTIYGNPIRHALVLPRRGRRAVLGDNDDQDGVPPPAPPLLAGTGPDVLTASFAPAAVDVAGYKAGGGDAKDDDDDDDGGGGGGGVGRGCVVGELLRESGHPIHNYVIACDANREARFVIRKGRLRSRVSVYQVVGDAAVTTDGKMRHSIAGQKVKLGSAVPHSSPAARKDRGAWMLYGEDVTRGKRSLASSLWPFGRVGGPTATNNNNNNNKNYNASNKLDGSVKDKSSGLEGGGAGPDSPPRCGPTTSHGGASGGEQDVLLAECLGQSVRFYGVLARSHPVDLFTLAMAVAQLWVEGESPTGGAGVRAAFVPRCASSHSLPVSWADEEASTTASRGLGASGNGGGGSSGGLFSGLIRGVGNKIVKLTDPKSPATNPLR